MDYLEIDKIKDDFRSFLRDTGAQIHRLLQCQEGRMRFTKQIERFMSLYETHKLEFNKLVEQAKRLEKDVEAPDDLAPTPLMWYRTPTYAPGSKGNFEVSGVIFPAGYKQRDPTQEETLMLYYVKLAVIYDLMYAQTVGAPKVYFDVDRIQNRSSEWTISEDVAYGIWNKMTNYEGICQDASAIEKEYIENALEHVRADLPAGTPQGKGGQAIMSYDDILQELTILISALRTLFRDVSGRSEGYARQYDNVLNVLFKVRRPIQSLEKILDKKNNKAIRRRCDEAKVSIKDLENILSAPRSEPDGWMQVVTCFQRVSDDLDMLSESLAEASQSPSEEENGGQGETQSKLTERETLSSLIPELALFDNEPKGTRMSSIMIQAQVAARYAAENNFAADQKEKLKSLFLPKYDLATADMRDFLNGLPDLTHDDRKHWHRELTSLHQRTKDLLWESLEENSANNERFVELLRKDMRIWGAIGFDAGSWHHGVIDPSTRELVTKKPAERERKGESVKEPPKEGGQKEQSLKDLENPVACSEVSGIVHKRSDNIARELKSHKYPVVKSGGKYYCNAEHAAVLWPKWKKRWKEKQEEEKF